MVLALKSYRRTLRRHDVLHRNFCRGILKSQMEDNIMKRQKYIRIFSIALCSLLLLPTKVYAVWEPIHPVVEFFIPAELSLLVIIIYFPILLIIPIAYYIYACFFARKDKEHRRKIMRKIMISLAGTFALLLLILIFIFIISIIGSYIIPA